jgi:hypothetical protein
MIANNAARFCHVIAAILAAHFIRGRSDDRGYESVMAMTNFRNRAG